MSTARRSKEERYRSALIEIRDRVEDDVDYNSSDGFDFTPANLEAEIWALVTIALEDR